MTADPYAIDDDALLAIADRAGGVSLDDLRDWVRRGWLDRAVVRRDARAVAVASARVLLIQEARIDLGVEDASVDLVIRLIEQIRLQTCKLDCLNAAIDQAPGVDGEALRQAAAAIFRERAG